MTSAEVSTEQKFILTLCDLEGHHRKLEKVE